MESFTLLDPRITAAVLAAIVAALTTALINFFNNKKVHNDLKDLENYKKELQKELEEGRFQSQVALFDDKKIKEYQIEKNKSLQEHRLLLMKEMQSVKDGCAKMNFKNLRVSNLEIKNLIKAISCFGDAYLDSFAQIEQNNKIEQLIIHDIKRYLHTRRAELIDHLDSSFEDKIIIEMLNGIHKDISSYQNMYKEYLQ